LVLSEFAGAAKELEAAVLVNPHDIDGMAQRISTALAMPLGERQERWRAMVAVLRSASVQAWFSDFVSALAEVRRDPLLPVAAAPKLLPALGQNGRSAAQAGA
jgi:trehalose 6-phosphate synthase